MFHLGPMSCITSRVILHIWRKRIVWTEEVILCERFARRSHGWVGTGFDLSRKGFILGRRRRRETSVWTKEKKKALAWAGEDRVWTEVQERKKKALAWAETSVCMEETLGRSRWRLGLSRSPRVEKRSLGFGRRSFIWMEEGSVLGSWSRQGLSLGKEKKKALSIEKSLGLDRIKVFGWKRTQLGQKKYLFGQTGHKNPWRCLKEALAWAEKSSAWTNVKVSICF